MPLPRKDEKPLSLVELLDKANSELKTVISKPNLLNAVPHDKQKIFFTSSLREKLFLGGNRSGKTFANVLECCWWLTKKHPYRPDVNAIPTEVRGRYISVDFLEGIEQIAIPYFKQLLPASELIDGKWEASYNANKHVLTLANGSFVEFMTYEQKLESFAGTSRHFIAYDEEPPQHIFVECRMRLVDTKGSWWISMTPDAGRGATWTYNTFFRPAKAGQRDQLLLIEIDSDENPHIESEEMDSALEGVSEHEKAARRKGTYSVTEGLIYPNYDPIIHTRHDFKLTHEMLIYTSYDHGWRHPAAWLWHAVEPDGRITTFHELIVSNHTIKQMADLVKEYERKNLYSKGFKVFQRICDPACAQTSGINGMSIISTYAMEEGLYMSAPETKGKFSVEVGLNRVQQYLRIDPYIHMPMWTHTPDCSMLSMQMAGYHWKNWANNKQLYENGPQNVIHKVNDDGPDSLRYFMTSMPVLYVKYDGAEKRVPRTHVAHMSAVPVFHAVAMENDVPLNDPHGDYRVYDESPIYGLENF